MTTTPEISVAPMMDWTDRHCRFFHRLLSPRARLYTEMITTGALIHGERERFLRFDKAEHPVALQLGGSDPGSLAACAAMGEEYGYDEINLNCGCPSDRVQEGRFGACLMKEPEHVAACVQAMYKSVDISVTIKCRIGIDDQDDFAFLDRFVGNLVDAGCKTFIMHARKAWLNGLSPKENREIPPLQYERVQEIKQKYPQLRIILNGGIKDIETINSVILSEAKDLTSAKKRDPSTAHLRCSAQDDSIRLDGVMIGREAYHNPWFLQEIEREFFNAPSPCPLPHGERESAQRAGEGETSRETVGLKMAAYAKKQKELYGTPVKSITRHILGLYHEQPRAKLWRRTLSTLPYEEGADETVILKALEIVEGEARIAA